MKILSVVGARPQFIKLAAIDHAIEDNNEHIIVHTGQHYDHNMSAVFFEQLNIAEPHYNLHVGSSSHAEQTGTMMTKLEEVFIAEQPDVVLVYGDTNSTLAAALTAIKIHLPVAHLEAGLRSFNRRMPEEHNRVLTDHASDLCLAPTEEAMKHLKHEGLAKQSYMVGDVMTDVLYETVSKADIDEKQHGSFTHNNQVIATIHRPDNTDDPVRLRKILDSLNSLEQKVNVVAHPRLMSAIEKHGLNSAIGQLNLMKPLPYQELMHSVFSSALVITDSGGLQKEAFLLRTPCLTLRPETEWVETVDLGWNVLVDVMTENLSEKVKGLKPEATDEAPYGDGTTAQQVIAVLEQHFATKA